MLSHKIVIAVEIQYPGWKLSRKQAWKLAKHIANLRSMQDLLGDTFEIDGPALLTTRPQGQGEYDHEAHRINL